MFFYLASPILDFFYNMKICNKYARPTAYKNRGIKIVHEVLAFLISLREILRALVFPSRFVCPGNLPNYSNETLKWCLWRRTVQLPDGLQWWEKRMSFTTPKALTFPSVTFFFSFLSYDWHRIPEVHTKEGALYVQLWKAGCHEGKPEMSFFLLYFIFASTYEVHVAEQCAGDKADTVTRWAWLCRALLRELLVGRSVGRNPAFPVQNLTPGPAVLWSRLLLLQLFSWAAVVSDSTSCS